MRAPSSHMIKDTPTLPDDRRMLPGVAYNLFQRDDDTPPNVGAELFIQATSALIDIYLDESSPMSKNC